MTDCAHILRRVAACVALAALPCAAIGCSGGASARGGASDTAGGAGAADTVAVAPTAFDADSAYSYVAAQVAFGPRVNGTKGHADCERYIVESLRRFGADTVTEQRATVTDGEGKKLAINNIMGSFNPTAKERVLLLAHYDTRPVADQDPDPANRAKAIPGANDGASGVGVLLEIARQLGLRAPRVGVDLLFVDAEDCGTDSRLPGSEATWCLGSQHWAANLPYDASNTPRYGILLDMVGGRDAVFNAEYFSSQYAPQVIAKVWGRARAEGYGSRFVMRRGGGVTDDHLPVNAAGIPCIDIIESDNATTGSFPPYWHTMADDMAVIDPATLRAVGVTVLSTIYHESTD